MTYDMTIFVSVFTLGAVMGSFLMWLVMRGRDKPVRTGSAELPVSANVTTLLKAPMKQRRTLTNLEPERIHQRALPPAPSAMGSALESPGITPDAETGVPEARDHHAIVTRTTPPRGSALYDSFAVEGERGWTPEEEHRLLSLYEDRHQEAYSQCRKIA